MQAKPGHKFVGEFRPRQGSASRRAEARFELRGLVIEADDRAEPRIWPFASLTTAAPSTGREPAIALSSTMEPDSTLFVRDPLFVSAAVQSAPQLTGRRQRSPAWFPMALSTVAFFAFLGALIYAVIAFLPYKTFARWIPDGTRETVGKLTIQNLSQGRKACEGREGRAAVDKLVLRLTETAKAPVKFNVTVIDWSLVNAFAAMGNQIVLTRGLIEAATSADEVAGVLAHEMGHSLEMHPEAGVLRAVGSVAIMRAILGGWSPDFMSDAGAQVVLLSYSRSAESEADEVGLRMLREAKIAPRGFANFFERLHAKAKKAGDPKLPDILSTHPPLPERAKRALAEGEYMATPAMTEAEWRALRAMCGAARP